MSGAVPLGWAETTLAALLDRIDAGKNEETLNRTPTGDEYGVIKVSAVTGGSFDPKAAKAIKADRFIVTAAVRRGDLLVARANGTARFIGAAVLVEEDHERLMLPDKVLRLHPNAAVDRRLLLHALRTQGAREFIEANATGIDVRNISQGKLGGVPVVLPPLNEQRRIVAKVDALLARRKKAREHLDRIPGLLDALKRSILAAAFRGDLTADWRAAHPDVEPASVLQERIRADRRRRWEDELRAKGKDPKKAKYEEPLRPTDATSDELPEGWAWASVDELCPIVQYGTSAKTSDDGPVPVVRMGNIVDGRLTFESLKFLPRDHEEFPELFLEPGDVLFNRTNSPELVGKCAVFEGSPSPCSFASYLIRLRADGFRPDLLAWCINGPSGRDWVASNVTQQTGQANVSGGKLRVFAVPLMSLAEQEILAHVVGAALARVEKLRRACRSAQSALGDANTSILSVAFKGELVPQDATDEPADALLDRIRAAQTAPAAKKARSPAEPSKDASAAEAIDLVVGVLVGGDKLTAERIRLLTALGKDDVKAVLKGLVDAGKVRVAGKARGTTYSWAGEA